MDERVKKKLEEMCRNCNVECIKEMREKCEEIAEFVIKCIDTYDGILSMEDGRREEYVRGWLVWLNKAYGDLSRAGLLLKEKRLAGAKEAKRVFNAYGKYFDKHRHEIVSVLVYVIKDEYKRDFANVLVGLFSLV